MNARGFTLVEVLVVVLIVGIISLFGLLSVRGGGEERVARDEVRRVERLVRLATDEALYRVVELGVEFHDRGYRFLEWNGSAWLPLANPGVLRDHAWPDALEVVLTVEGEPQSLPSGPDDEAPTPQVVFLSSGEVSPFRLTVVAADRRGETLQVHATAESERAPVEGVLP